VPLAQPSRSAGQYFSQPQQMLSGWAGLTGILAIERLSGGRALASLIGRNVAG